MAMTDAGRKRIESVDEILGDDLRVPTPESPLDAFELGLREGSYALRLQDARFELREVDGLRRTLLHKIAGLRAKAGAAPETRELL